jgi:hypothetical protein
MRIVPLLILLGLLVGCQGGGDFSLFGYSTKPPFDPNIRTIYIPVFKITCFHTNPYRGIEVDLTEAIVREINERRTPLRVVSDISQADTELVGNITNIAKIVQNRTLENLNREFDLLISAEVVWRDLRTGKVLSNSRQADPERENPIPFDPSLPPPAPPKGPVLATATTLTSMGRVLPEVGETNATGQQMAVKQMARQIVNMMEQPWSVPPRKR